MAKKSRDGKTPPPSLHTTSGIVGNPRSTCVETTSGPYTTWTITVTAMAQPSVPPPPNSESVESIKAYVKDSMGNTLTILDLLPTGNPNEYARSSGALRPKPTTVDVTTTFVTRTLLTRSAGCGCR